MAWIQLTQASGGRKTYVNTDLIYQVTQAGKTRLHVAVAAKADDSTSLWPMHIEVAESIEQVMEMMHGAGEKVVSRLGS